MVGRSRTSPRLTNILTFQPPAAQPAAAGEHTVGRLLDRMIEGGESFWPAVHVPFMERDLSRDLLRAVVGAGLERTCGNYRALVELFNMPRGDYKRFLSFLRKHECQVPFHSFRALRPRSVGEEAGMDDHPHAAVV